MQTRAARAARGWLVGTAAMVIAAVGHDLGGGDFPGWLALLVGVVFAGCLGTLLTARAPSLPRLALIVVGSQAAFHYLFVLLGGPLGAGAATGSGGATVAVAGHDHGGAALTALPALASSGHGAHLAEPSMALAHLAAAVVTVVLLRSAEAALWGLLVEFGRFALVLLAVSPALPVPVRMPRARLVETALPRLHGRLLARTLARRGPPALSFA